MTAAARLVCDDTRKTYGGAFTLGPLSLALTPGVTCLVGANGAGKSTFFRLAARVDRPTSGVVRLDGTDGASAVGYLPQEPTLPAGATCREFLTYVAWLHRVPRQRRHDAATAALERVGLADRQDTKIRALSGGMRRRLGIAHAVVHEPVVVLLDEPTAGLDPGQRVRLREFVRGIGDGRIVVVSTHLVEDVRALADRVVVLNDGRLVYDGDVGGLSAQARPDAPGESDLERAVAALMAGPE